MIADYIHKVQYYETDKMQITHHSNYARFMEEARVDFLDRIGYSYDRMEREGIFSVVVNISCDFKKPTIYADLINIKVSVLELTQVRIKFGYTMKVNDEIVCIATSEHCCLNKNGKITSLKRENAELYELLNSFIVNE